ncbi:protein nucleotidyltransferase YdiU-like isoform X6 [Paroedura picta]|uniref:protein nucleotidyltransferase YdiU-like isoform X6 n=1 Tax=Paroedura picta TaxID=143630 RepID=UPI0040562F15
MARLGSGLGKVLGRIMCRCSAQLWWLPWLMWLCPLGGCFQDSLVGGSRFRHVHRHHYINKSDLDQGYCERKRKLSSLGGWRLSTEELTGAVSCQCIAALPIDPIEKNYVRQVRDAIFSIVQPTPFKSRVLLVAVSEEVLEDILDLDVSASGTEDFLQLVSGEKIALGSLPLAHRYGGHQFGSWAGQLGDGRAHLIGVYTNRFGDKWELQLKGSGRTPYSRNGDGRAVLRSSVREFLGSEAMHYLGIPTSRAASLVVSDDDVWRDQFYNGDIKKERGAVVLRVAKSWFRIGSLEILAHYGEIDLLRMLLDLVIEEHFPSVGMNDSNRYLAFFSRVVSETADLIALWMSVGFAHGVCNTDNFSLLSITIDYGPFGFMDSYDPVLLRFLRDTLICTTDELFKAKLGLLGSSDEDGYLIAFLLKLMEDVKADFTMTFRQLSEISLDLLKDFSISQEFWALQDIAKHKLFPSWVAMYLLRLQRNAGDSESDRKRRMSEINPRYVLRNWMAESAIRKAERNDFSEVHLLLRVLQHPFKTQTVAERAGYAQRPPAWAKEIKVSCSS